MLVIPIGFQDADFPHRFQWCPDLWSKYTLLKCATSWCQLAETYKM